MPLANILLVDAHLQANVTQTGRGFKYSAGCILEDLGRNARRTKFVHQQQSYFINVDAHRCSGYQYCNQHTKSASTALRNKAQASSKPI